MARLIIDLTEAEKKAIVDYAKTNNITIKSAVLSILSKKITELKKSN